MERRKIERIIKAMFIVVMCIAVFNACLYFVTERFGYDVALNLVNTLKVGFITAILGILILLGIYVVINIIFNIIKG